MLELCQRCFYTIMANYHVSLVAVDCHSHSLRYYMVLERSAGGHLRCLISLCLTTINSDASTSASVISEQSRVRTKEQGWSKPRSLSLMVADIKGSANLPTYQTLYRIYRTVRYCTHALALASEALSLSSLSN
eukprot:scaffold10708_cov157-Skeletonema_dohrnii-CCMP3373.AAC.5